MSIFIDTSVFPTLATAEREADIFGELDTDLYKLDVKDTDAILDATRNATYKFNHLAEKLPDGFDTCIRDEIASSIQEVLDSHHIVIDIERALEVREW
jgi:hypothetical protein